MNHSSIHLTPLIIWAYAGRALATSNAGFRSLNDSTGAQAPNDSVSGVFLRLGASLFDGVRWEASGLAGVQCFRSANPTYAVTILFRSGGCRLVYNTALVSIMVKSLFTVRSEVTPAQLAQSVCNLNVQSLALQQAISDFASDSAALKDRAGYCQFANLLWAQETLLEQQSLLCERLEGRV